MATYKGIKGVKVQTKATDPTASEAEGTVWYNSTGDALKYAIQGAGAWSSGGAMNTLRAQDAIAGTQTAAIITGGAHPPTYTPTNSESYNGTAWTEGNNLTQGRNLASGAGTQTAALTISGYYGYLSYAPEVESWNGTSWSEVADVNTARSQGGGCGLTNTAALLFGGESPPHPVSQPATESYNGTSWTEVNKLNTGRYMNSGSGSSTSALTTGGTPYLTSVESWDGTSWTEVNNLNIGRIGPVGAGTNNTSGLAIGGAISPLSPPASYLDVTEQWNGTSWTEIANLATGRMNGSGVGAASASTAIYAGGNPGSPASQGSVTTEEWNDPVYTIKTVTVS